MFENVTLFFLKEALYYLTNESSTLNKTNLQYTLLVLESQIFMFHFKKTKGNRFRSVEKQTV